LDGGVPGAVAESVLNLSADLGEALEKKLADVGQGDGVAWRNAVLRDEREEFAEDVVDIAGGPEIAGKGDELASSLIGSEELLFAAGVVDTEGAVLRPAGHAAGAAVPKGEAAQVFGRTRM